jgi:hypothetical protein
MGNLTEIQFQQLRQFNDCIVEHTLVKKIFNDFDELRQMRNTMKPIGQYYSSRSLFC